MESYSIPRVDADIETDEVASGIVEKYNLDLIEIKEGCKYYTDNKYNFIIKYDIVNEVYILDTYVGESENVIIPPYVNSCDKPFIDCTLNRLEVNGIESNFKSLCSMFEGFKGKEIQLINFNTSNVDDMDRMFCNCQNLILLDLGDEFNTSRVRYMTSMFDGCLSLTTLNLGNKFNTGRVYKMDNMVQNCKSLISLDLGDNFYTCNVETMRGIFYGCSSLVTLNLGSEFTMDKVYETSYMFGGCWALTNVYLGCYSSRNTIESELERCEISLDVLN